LIFDRLKIFPAEFIHYCVKDSQISHVEAGNSYLLTQLAASNNIASISTVLCQKALSAIFTFFLQERQKTDYNQLLVTLIFGKMTKYSAPNCPFTKLSCFFDYRSATLFNFR